MVGAVPDAVRVRHRLLGHDVASEVHVVAPEVDQLTGTVDLRLGDGLALAEHGGGVDPRPPRTGEQVGGLQQHRGAVVEGQLAPSRRRRPGRVDGELRVGGRRIAHRAEHLRVRVRLTYVDRRAAPGHPPAADGVRQIDRRRRQLLQGDVQVRALGAPRPVLQDGLVAGGGDGRDGIHERWLLRAGTAQGDDGPAYGPAMVARRPAVRRPGTVASGVAEIGQQGPQLGHVVPGQVEVAVRVTLAGGVQHLQADDPPQIEALVHEHPAGRTLVTGRG